MTTSASSPFRCLSAADAATLLRSEAGITVFDVRDLASYQRGHVSGAAHLDEQRFPLWLRRIEKAAPVVIYCYHGNASKTFAQMFADFRFTRVFSVDGGYEPLAAALAAA
ncbi:thiosulfate sulfurtransferase GlpE [Dechloromonas sp. H13]|uniref:thiosulfate sulfurtransferase GlpE n=1 Tax=Dechloromonas sp. H13 TaxID=2570193 RepID=UPI001291CB09|nr:thiosulfate sulfurtransferase GlpE [Dechloromonas sp. H13]